MELQATPDEVRNITGDSVELYLPLRDYVERIASGRLPARDAYVFTDITKMPIAEDFKD